MATITNADLREDIQALRKDMSELINNGLPTNYVQLRAHEAALRAHDDRITAVTAQVAVIMQKSDTGTAWANQEHSNMRKEWAEDMKKINESMVELSKVVVRMSEHLGTLIKILLWALGIVSTLFLGVVGGLLVAILTHAIHFN